MILDTVNYNQLIINNIEKLVGTELRYTLWLDKKYTEFTADVSEVHTGQYYYRIELDNTHTIFIDREVYGSEVLILAEVGFVGGTVRFEHVMDIAQLSSIRTFCARMVWGKWTQTR